MSETCAVCHEGKGPEKCEVCGFSDNGSINRNRQFPIPEDAKNWIETVVKPYRAQWLAQLEEKNKKITELEAQNKEQILSPPSEPIFIICGAIAGGILGFGVGSTAWSYGVDFSRMDGLVPTGTILLNNFGAFGGWVVFGAVSMSVTSVCCIIGCFKAFQEWSFLRVIVNVIAITIVSGVIGAIVGGVTGAIIESFSGFVVFIVDVIVGIFSGAIGGHIIKILNNTFWRNT